MYGFYVQIYKKTKASSVFVFQEANRKEQLYLERIFLHRQHALAREPGLREP